MTEDESDGEIGDSNFIGYFLFIIISLLERFFLVPILFLSSQHYKKIMRKIAKAKKAKAIQTLEEDGSNEYDSEPEGQNEGREEDDESEEEDPESEDEGEENSLSDDDENYSDRDSEEEEMSEDEDEDVDGEDDAVAEDAAELVDDIFNGLRVPNSDHLLMKINNL